MKFALELHQLHSLHSQQLSFNQGIIMLLVQTKPLVSQFLEHLLKI